MKIEIGKGGAAVAKLKQGEIKKITKIYEGDEKDFKGPGIEGTKDKRRRKRKKKHTRRLA
ncbi:MAG: hypothetical protein JYX80_11495 [Candidatus Scalindua sediminis]|nr:hypothetical protein [Candidatus Scalindua sediminis]